MQPKETASKERVGNALAQRHGHLRGCLAVGVLIAAVCPPSSRAADWYWSGDCGTSDWHGTCTDWDECAADPVRYWYYNNWGEVACDDVPGPAFPGDADNVVLEGDTVDLYSDETIAGLALDATANLRIRGATSVPTLTLLGAQVTNDGSIWLNHNLAGTAILECENSALFEGNGEVVLGFGGTYAQLNSGPGATLTQALGHSIRGMGQLNATLVNNGSVIADVTNQSLELTGGDKTNNATMKAVGGSRLDFADLSVTQGSQGALLAEGSSSQFRLKGNATIDGGTVGASSGGYGYVLSGTNTLANVTLDYGTWLGINGGASPTLRLAGTACTNHGSIIVNSSGGGSGVLLAAEDVTLQGDGEVVLNCSGTGAQLNTTGGGTLTHAAAHTIHGKGTINASLVNNGTVSADESGQRVLLRGSDKVNNAVMQAEAGGMLDIQGLTLTQSPDGVLRGAGGSVLLQGDAVIVGGTLATINGGLIISEAGTNTLDNTAIDAGTWIGIRGGSTILRLTGETTTNDGSIVVNYVCGGQAVLLVENDLMLQGSGNIVLDCSGAGAQLNTALGVTLLQAANHTITGNGQINAALDNYGVMLADRVGAYLRVNPQAPGITNHGTVSVQAGCHLEVNDANLYAQMSGETITNGVLHVNGGPLDLQGGTLSGTGSVSGEVANAAAIVDPGNSAGTLTISGNYTQAVDGTLRIQLGGTDAGEYDKLEISGAASLDGTLTIEPIDDFIPEVGQQFTIMTCASRTGEFATVSGIGTYNVAYDSGSVTLTVLSATQPGDLDADGDVDLDDYSIFVDCMNGPAVAYPLGCDAADLELDGDVDLADFAVFQRAFNRP